MTGKGELLLFLETKRGGGKSGYMKIICRVDSDGNLNVQTMKTIIRFINEELKHMECEDVGETYSPNTLKEFPAQKVWPRKYEGQG